MNTTRPKTTSGRKEILPMPEKAKALIPKNQTLLEKMAGKRYRLGWDGAIDPKHPPRNTEERNMYQLIVCRPGNIYEHSENFLAWYCPSRRKGLHALKVLGGWFQVHVEAEAEWIFTFPSDKFSEVTKVARPHRIRQVSEEVKARLREHSRRRSAPAGSELSAPRKANSPSPVMLGD